MPIHRILHATRIYHVENIPCLRFLPHPKNGRQKSPVDLRQDLALAYPILSGLEIVPTISERGRETTTITALKPFRILPQNSRKIRIGKLSSPHDRNFTVPHFTLSAKVFALK